MRNSSRRNLSEAELELTTRLGVESRMRYLVKAQSHVLKAKVDAVQWKKQALSTVKTGVHRVPLETKLFYSEE